MMSSKVVVTKVWCDFDQDPELSTPLMLSIPERLRQSWTLVVDRSTRKITGFHAIKSCLT